MPAEKLRVLTNRDLTINGTPWAPADPNSPGGQSSRGPHRLQSVRKCEFKWALRYAEEHTKGRLLSYVKEEIPLIGTAMHTRAAFHHALEMSNPPGWAVNGDVEAEVAKDVKGHPKAPEFVELTRSMWAAVCESTPASDWPEPYAVEREVWAPLGELDPGCPRSLRDEVVTARLDLLALQHKRLKKGQVMIWDYKTTGGYKKAGEDFVRLPRWEGANPWWSMHYQGALAISIARAMFNIPVAGFFIIRVSREAPHVVDRHVLSIPDRIVERAGELATEAVIHEQRVLERMQSKLPPLLTGVQTGHCGDFGGCEYLPLCQASDKSVRNALLETDYFRQKI